MAAKPPITAIIKETMANRFLRLSLMSAHFTEIFDEVSKIPDVLFA
jgi:hypothetical protein